MYGTLYNDELQQNDENKNLLGFDTKVYDFNEHCFRDGKPKIMLVSHQ